MRAVIRIRRIMLAVLLLAGICAGKGYCCIADPVADAGAAGYSRVDGQKKDRIPEAVLQHGLPGHTSAAAPGVPASGYGGNWHFSLPASHAVYRYGQPCVAELRRWLLVAGDSRIAQLTALSPAHGFW